MQTKVALIRLRELADEARREGLALRPSAKFSSWKGRVQSVLTHALGADHHLTKQFIQVRYGLPIVTDRTPAGDFDRAFLGGLAKAQGVMEAAIYELELAGTSADAVDETAFDPALWSHVQTHVQNEDWQTVASQTAIFVEDCVRQWCGAPTGKDGKALVGQALFGRVLADDAQFRLGKEPGEWHGWRSLGTGFAQALSNVDRHNIQRRDDAKRYAFGVLGLGSLILTQLRHQYSDDLNIQ